MRKQTALAVIFAAALAFSACAARDVNDMGEIGSAPQYYGDEHGYGSGQEPPPYADEQWEGHAPGFFVTSEAPTPPLYDGDEHGYGPGQEPPPYAEEQEVKPGVSASEAP